MKKIFIFLGIAILFIILGRRLFFSTEKTIETEAVKIIDLTQIVSASGKIKSDNIAELKFLTGGKIVWIGAKEQEKVSKWQALASLDKREVELNIRKKLLAYLNERWDFEQERNDYEASGITLEKALLTDEEKRILEKSQYDLDTTVADVEIYQLAKENSVLLSPFNGIVTYAKGVIPGFNVTAGEIVFTVVDPDNITFLASIDELDIGKIAIGQEAIIMLDAYPEDKISAKVAKIGFTALATAGGGTAFPVEILLPSDQFNKFKIGMNGDTEIIINQKSQVLAVSSEAVFTENEESYTWKQVNQKFIKQKITVGMENDEYIEIIDGLLPNDIIMKNPSEYTGS